MQRTEIALGVTDWAGAAVPEVSEREDGRRFTMTPGLNYQVAELFYLN